MLTVLYHEIGMSLFTCIHLALEDKIYMIILYNEHFSPHFPKSGHFSETYTFQYQFICTGSIIQTSLVCVDSITTFVISEINMKMECTQYSLYDTHK